MYNYVYSKVITKTQEYIWFDCYLCKGFAFADCKTRTLKFKPTKHPRMQKFQEQVKKDYPEYKVIPW